MGILRAHLAATGCNGLKIIDLQGDIPFLLQVVLKQ